MDDLSARSHRCSTCGAPLAIENARHEILRCRYCGSDHKLVSAKAEAQTELRAERRIGAVVAPYILGPLLGFAGFFALRDFLWSPYEGKPAMVVAIIFLVIGLMSFRIPAALGLAVVGLAGVLKPFVRPVSIWYDGTAHTLSPTSETAFYYLVPGILSAIVGFAFFSSLKVRDFGPALHALVPRLSMIAATAAGIVAGYFFLGETGIEMSRRYQPVVDEWATLANSACEGTLPDTLQAPLEPSPAFAKNHRGNILMVSCEAIKTPGKTGNDPLYLDQLSWLIAESSSTRKMIYAGASSWAQAHYQHAERARYLVAYQGAGVERTATVVDRESKTAMKLGGQSLSNDTQLFAVLAKATGGSFPEGRGVGRASSSSSPSPSITAEKAPIRTAEKVPIRTEFEFHTAAANSLGTLWVYGFVTNTSTIATDKPEVLVILKDKDGREIRTANSYATHTLQPGERSPIGIMVTEPPEYETLEFEANPRRLAGVTVAEGLLISDSTQTVAKKTLNISGKVRNDGKAPARFVQVHTLQYGADDKLIGIHNVYVKAETLEAGSDARFLDTIYGFDEETMRVELRVSGGEGRR